MEFYFLFGILSAVMALHLKGEDEKKPEIKPEVFSRQKRQTSPERLTIEVLFVVDYAAYSRFLNLSNGDREQTERRLEIYYARVFDGLDRRYRGIRSSEVSFVLTYSDLNVTEKPEQSIWTTPIKQEPEVDSPREMVDTDAALGRFLNWIEATKDLPNFDYAVLFTGYNLTYGGSSSNTGLSYPSSICQNISLQGNLFKGPVAIVEETYDTETIINVAKELGRSLGSNRDFDSNSCFPSELYIMTPRFRFPDERRAPNLWKFSPCSVTYFEAFVKALHNTSSETCLSNNESSEYIPDVPRFLRQRSATIVNIDDQCRIVNGPRSFLCRALQSVEFVDFGSICRGAYCYIESTQTCKLILPGDGTLCGNKSICSEGQCKFSEEAPETSANCTFGDQPFIPFSDDCEERISLRGFDCYQEQIRVTCCDSCEEQYTGKPGCEYGDRWSLCNASLCSTYDNYTRDILCCRKCDPNSGPKPYSNSSILTSIATTAVTEVGMTSENVQTAFSDGQTSDIMTTPTVSVASSGSSSSGTPSTKPSYQTSTTLASSTTGMTTNYPITTIPSKVPTSTQKTTQTSPITTPTRLQSASTFSPTSPTRLQSTSTFSPTSPTTCMYPWSLFWHQRGWSWYWVNRWRNRRPSSLAWVNGRLSSTLSNNGRNPPGFIVRSKQELKRLKKMEKRRQKWNKKIAKWMRRWF